MKVGVVMTTINLWAKYTKPAIDSVCDAMNVAVLKGMVKDSDISFLLIDNASTDDTQKAATEMFQGSQRHLNYHRNEERWGFQRSVNFGVKFYFDKGYDLVLVLNNDIVLHKDAVWRLVERFEKGAVAMATCLDITGESGGAQHVQTMSSEEKTKCEETPHPCFSAFMVNRECWEKVGEFDEAFYPAYFEDNDYHYRIQLTGLLAVTYPPAMFFHYASRTNLEGTPEVSPGTKHAQFDNNRATYVRKWGGLPGHEQFKNPYNMPTQAVTSVRQRS